MKFFLDHCISNTVAESLRSWGHEVIRLRDELPTDSGDEIVIAKAQELDSILVTLNGDFANIVVYLPSRYAGIIALQVKNHPEQEPSILATLADYLAVNRERDHYRSRLFVVESHRIRIRQ